MRKPFIFSITFLLLYSLTYVLPVQAESTENVTKRRPDRPAQAQIQEIRQENRSNVAELHATRLERRFKFYYERLNNIMTRFQARLDLLTSEGKSTSTVQLKLSTAKAKLEEAKLKGARAIAAFRAIDPVKVRDQKSALLIASNLATEARKLFQDTLDLLKLAFKELKTISKPALPAASSAIQNTLK